MRLTGKPLKGTCYLAFLLEKVGLQQQESSEEMRIVQENRVVASRLAKYFWSCLAATWKQTYCRRLLKDMQQTLMEEMMEGLA